MEPLAGAAPAGFPYKGNLQAAAKRQRQWWPARVTRPVLRIKSPLHHFNACRPKKWSQSRVLPSAELAYETCLSAGSTAMLAHGHLGTRPTKWSPHPELHRAKTRVPGECIADNALGALKMVGARRLARPRLPDSESGGSAFPREPRAAEIGVPDRLRSGDLLHERQACWTGLHHRD
jgi:hypothetical protein